MNFLKKISPPPIANLEEEIKANLINHSGPIVFVNLVFLLNENWRESGSIFRVTSDQVKPIIFKLQSEVFLRTTSDEFDYYIHCLEKE